MGYDNTYAILSQTTVKIPVTLKHFLIRELTLISFHNLNFLLKLLLDIQPLPSR